MSIDQRAMLAASNAYAEYVMARPGTWKINDALRVTIAAYEAARWRPIEEAPRDIPVLVCLVDCRHEVYIATHGNDWRFDTYDDELTMTHQDLIERGALFRYLPTPRALSTSPAADIVEEVK